LLPRGSRGGKALWQAALPKAEALYEKRHTTEDPWPAVLAMKPERALRHIYDPETGWQTREALIKLDMSKPFAAGAMRNCFKVKMFVRHTAARRIGDWHWAENFVGKMYIDPDVDNRSAVLEDITMQMDCKKWADQFNISARKGEKTPSRVDMIQISGLELLDRPGVPLLCCERFIQGQYIKYNSNSGYIDTSPGANTVRNTPQAFSHFTYEASHGKLLVADVQGVGNPNPTAL